MAILNFRGGLTEFEMGQRLAQSGSVEDRVIAADLLGQLGWGKRTYLNESVDVLLPLLNDPEPSVIASAASALGHRSDARAVAPLAALALHSSSEIRFAVAVALGRQVDDAAAEAQAAEALIVLSRDENRDTRNWAMFGLGNLESQDSPAIRAALWAGLDDSDHEIRGESLVGLAKRKVPGTAQAIRAEWERDFISLLSLEAAEELRDPGLWGELLKLQGEGDWSGENFLRDQLELAISACREAAQ